MGKLRVKYLIIAVVFVLLGILGGVVAYLEKDTVVFAAFQHGSGTEQDPYRIYNDNQLYNLQEISSSSLAKERTKDKYFKLMKNVKGTYRTKKNSYGFYGTLDGNGYSVTLENYPLFYVLKENSSVINLTVNKTAETTLETDVYSLTYYVNNGSVVDNCVFNSDITILIPSYNSPQNLSCTACCKYNNGTIKNSKFIFNVDMKYASEEKHGRLAKVFISAVAYSGNSNGIIEECVINGNYSTISATLGTFRIAGIALEKNAVNHCEFNGNINVTYRSARTSSYLVYGITSDIATDCTFNGNITMNFTPHKYGMAGEGSTVTHNGEIVITQ